MLLIPETAMAELHAIRARLAALQAPGTPTSPPGEIEAARAAVRELTARSIGVALQMRAPADRAGVSRDEFAALIYQQNAVIEVLKQFTESLDVLLAAYEQFAEQRLAR